MGYKTEISWTDSSWTPLRARIRKDAREIAQAKGYTSLLPIIQPGRVGPHCEHVSPGCEHCYSERNNGRSLPHNGTGLPFDRRARDLVEMFIDEKILTQPLRWRKPRKVFVCSQTDLFGEWVPDEMIDRVLAVMALCPQHEFQILTKREGRMQEYFSSSLRSSLIAYWEGVMQMVWPPLSNIWLGVSAEDQQRANERISVLCELGEAGWNTMVSLEPLLSPVRG